MPESLKTSQNVQMSSSEIQRGKSSSANNVGQKKKREKASKSKASVKNEENLENEEICLICANSIKYAAYSSCHHVTCHTCTFRQRALYEKNQCLVCRSEEQSVVFSDKLEQEYGDFDLSACFSYDEKYLVHFSTEIVHEETMKLMENKCVQCKNSFVSFKKLTEHVKSEHNKFFCLICSKNKKAFVSELPLYSYKQLQKHQTEGDVSGFKGHPECKHCKGKRFYSEDELHVHIRDRHERCYICDQDIPNNADYYNNYDDLYNHFKASHYVCSVPSCVEKRFVVFREDLDLTAHMLKEHGGLTGNNKIVMGSSSRDFQSQLSTFRSSNVRNEESSRNEQNSPATKKKRFEERARHYLNYDNSNFKQFVKYNNNFKMGELTSQELLHQYRELFKHQTDQDLHLLTFEFAQLFPSSSPLHKVLLDISNDLNRSAQDQFPVLGGSSRSESPGTFHSWSSNVTSKKHPEESFPVLAKPKPKTVQLRPQSTSNNPIKYNSITSDKKGNIKTALVSAEQAGSDYRPTYLDRSASSSSSSLVNNANGSSSSRNSPNLSNEKFPALVKKQTKKPIPRVKKYDIADPNQWGKSQTKEEEEAREESADEKTDRRKQKLKKKQQKTLFTM